LFHHEGPLEGPIVAPDETSVAEHLSAVHGILRQHGAMLLYAGQWVYVPNHAILKIERGGHRFALPWPL
jgi:hypothetical protein